MSDIKMILGPDGSRLQFSGGAALVDNGLENLALISLFTSLGWCGNTLLSTPIGSDFEQTCNQPLNMRALNDIRNSAERALKHPAFGKVTVTVTNPESQRLVVNALLEPPGKNPTELRFNRSGRNWEYQAKGPAYEQVKDKVDSKRYLTFGDDQVVFDNDAVYF